MQCGGHEVSLRNRLIAKHLSFLAPRKMAAFGIRMSGFGMVPRFR